MLWCSSNAVEATFLERKWHVLVRPAVHLQEKCYRVRGARDPLGATFRVVSEAGIEPATVSLEG
jgi:hypothetical protein